MKHTIQKLSVLTLVLTVLFTTALPAQAELSSENKETLKEIMANNPNDLLAIMTYLYSLMYQGTSLPGTTTGTKTTETPSTTTTETPQNNAQLCTYAKGITKNLSRGMNDPQVKTLQKFLNALAVQDTNYNAVIASGDGSYGNETTYFGSGTQNAVKVLQGRLRVLQSGMVGPLTRAAMMKKVCGTGSTTSTPNTRTQTTNSNTSSQTSDVSSVDSSVPQLTLELSQERPGNIGGDNWWMVVLAWNVDGFGTCKLQTKPDGGTYTSGFSLVPTNQGLTSRETIDIRKSSTFRISCPRGQMSKEIYVPVSFDGSTTSGDTQSSVGEVTATRQPQMSASKTTASFGDTVLLVTDTNGFSGCRLKGGVYNVATSGEGQRTWRADKTTTFTLACDGGQSSVTVTVEPE